MHDRLLVHLNDAFRRWRSGSEGAIRPDGVVAYLRISLVIGLPWKNHIRLKLLCCADGCSRRRRVALILATICLSGRATGASDVDGLGACPPVVEYSREFRARAAEEIALQTEGAAIVEMMSDYAVMREQARVCGGL
jgi:hypothetical protein